MPLTVAAWLQVAGQRVRAAYLRRLGRDFQAGTWDPTLLADLGRAHECGGASGTHPGSILEPDPDCRAGFWNVLLLPNLDRAHEHEAASETHPGSLPGSLQGLDLDCWADTGDLMLLAAQGCALTWSLLRLDMGCRADTGDQRLRLGQGCTDACRGAS